MLKTEKEWSLVTAGTLARESSIPNFWVQNNDISKTKIRKI